MVTITVRSICACLFVLALVLVPEGSCHNHGHQNKKRTLKKDAPEGLYFYISVYKHKCFYEELPGETIIKGSYEHSDPSRKPIDIILSGPSGEVLLEKRAEGKSRFAHHALEAGMHKICIVPNTSSRPWPAHDPTVKFRLVIEVQAEDAEVGDDIANKKHVSALEEAIAAMESKMTLIMKNLEYNHKQEMHFRDQSERINARIIFWSLVQSSVLIVSGVWQIIHLKGFFRSKKLV
mmetsp:Transcript_17244/g.19611  ORF Transcript_17244/g.19611 Transcript_17244/m.19611 type:complete len:235 (-) Transcript_17244:972-1676(-)